MTAREFIKALPLETIRDSYFQIRKPGEKFAIYSFSGKGHEIKLKNGAFIGSFGDTELDMEYNEMTCDRDERFYVFYI